MFGPLVPVAVARIKTVPAGRLAVIVFQVQLLNVPVLVNDSALLTTVPFTVIERLRVLVHAYRKLNVRVAAVGLT